MSGAASAAPGASSSRLCRFGAQCRTFAAARERYVFSPEVLEHLTRYIHPADTDCRYKDKCRAWRRLIDGGERVDDKCHCAIFRHPPRVQRDLGENDEYVGARWRRWNTLDCKFPNIYYNPLLKEERTEEAKRATPEYWSSSPNKSQLEDEVRREGFAHVLTCTDGQPLSNIVLQKLQCGEHQKLGCPLSYDGMLSIILYTGTDAYSSLRRYQLEHQRPNPHCSLDVWTMLRVANDAFHEARIQYTRWNVFDLSLSCAVEDLGEAQLRTYGRRRGIPSEHVYHGSHLCTPPPKENHQPKEEVFRTYGELPTVTSFSWDINQAIQFSRGEGLVIKFNAADVRSSSCHATTDAVPASWCDVSWISKFPLECETLFSHYSGLGDLLEQKVLSTSPSLVMMHYDAMARYSRP